LNDSVAAQLHATMTARQQLRRVDPARNMRRFYLVGVHGDLLAGWSVLREWGRIGRHGRVRVEPFTELAAAEAAGARIERAKRRRGYA
jgi:predicted DNA-binding WGR domain protein